VDGLKHRLAQPRKRYANVWATRIVQWRLRLVLFGRRARACLGASIVSLFSFGIGAAILVIPQIRATFDSFRPLEAILSQLGATYGTILALVLTISIIPIQRAAEVWSPSIVRLYRRDPVTYVTFVGLGVFCAGSFLLAVRGAVPAPVSVVLVLSLVVLGVTLDILRWYHGHVCQLLDPVHAVSLALKEGKQAIGRTQTLVTRAARLQHRLLDAEQQRAVSVEDIESIIYPQVLGYQRSINSWTNDLAEIGIKAVARGERRLAKAAVSAIADLTAHFLSSRKFNLTVRLAPEAMLLAKTSDVSVVTGPAYEALKEVSRVAATRGDEATAIGVSEGYRALASHTAHLNAPAFRNSAAPLTSAPIYYAFECVKYAQSKQLDEVSFQSAAILSKVAETAPKDIQSTDIHVPVIDGLTEIALYFYAKRSHGLAEEVIGHHFSIVATLLWRNDYYFDDVLKYVLKKMEMLAPFAIINESMAGNLTLIHPLGKAYGLVSANSLAHLFQHAAGTLPRLNPEREWINPYHDLANLTDIIAGHLRRMAECNEFGESFLLWNINKSIVHIATVIANLLDHPLRPHHGDETEIIDKLCRILTFYWVAFNGKKSVGEQRADDCCDSLVFIGMQFLERGQFDVLRTCIANIRSIMDSYCEIARPAKPYAIGDLLAHLWGIRLVLIARDNNVLAQVVDQTLAAKPRGLTEELWQAAQEAIVLRRQQLEARLAQRDDGLDSPDSAEALLRRLLKDAQGQAA